ncbi:MAG: beta-galactosidase [Alphaproteobacteria bacterium]|nr:beta-galactosidase [Alphaproteobacteria bacterium]
MKPALGVCYYPEHWHEEIWQDDAKRMTETGIAWVRIGEFAWSQLEAQEGCFTWDWLDKAVDILGKAGLKIIMGTPSATPPKWVLEKYPDMLAVDAQGKMRKFGSRRHYCFSHSGYRAEAARMAQDMAKRYGKNPHVQAWQIDNEYGCHDTTLSYSDAVKQEFRIFLSQKYQSADALNKAWGNVFWSMEYETIDSIDLPNQTVTEANPAHWLDFRLFLSKQVVRFNQAQVNAIRPYTDKPLTHNYMGRYTAFDHFAVGDDLDIASWDSYPLGFLEQMLDDETEAHKNNFYRQGDPDFQAFHHDLYRSIGHGRMWVMEQQPGPVNWAPYNPIPLDGMVALWTMEAFAHGAEMVSYFRWRQAPFAQEQMHTGLLRVNGDNARGQIEAKQVADALENLPDIEQITADVAIIFDYQSQWAWQIQPQGKSFDYFRLIFEHYRALRQLGLNVDILPSNVTDFGDRKLVFIPALMAWNDNLKQAIKKFSGIVVAGPRTASKTAAKTNYMQISPTAPDFADCQTLRVASLRDGITIKLAKGGAIIRWFEELQGDKGFEFTDNTEMIASRDGNHIYIGAWLNQTAYQRIFTALCDESNITTKPLPDGLRIRTVKDKQFMVNYSAQDIIFDGVTIPKADYLWR